MSTNSCDPFASQTRDAPAGYVLLLLRKVESTIGAFFAFLLGFVIAVFGGDIAYLSYGSSGFFVFFLIYLFLMVCEGAFLYFLKEALEKPEYPFAPWFAAGRIRWPILLRPLVALWWLAHLAIGVGGSTALQYALSNSVFHGENTLSWFFAFTVVSFTVAYSANLYALLAISAMGFGAQTLHLIWRWRLLLDVAITILAQGWLHHVMNH